MSRSRIQITSDRLATLCTLLLGILPVSCVLYWTLSSPASLSGQWTWDPHAVVRLDWTGRFAALVVTGFMLIPFSLCLARLRRLLRLYAAGTIFGPDNVAAMSGFGKWLVWTGVTSFFYRTLIALVLTLPNPPGQRLLVVGTDSGQIVAMLLGGVMLVIARVMDEAREMAEEQAQTV